MDNELISVSIKQMVCDLGVYGSYKLFIHYRFYSRQVDLTDLNGAHLITKKDAQKAAEQFLDEHCKNWR